MTSSAPRNLIVVVLLALLAGGAWFWQRGAQAPAGAPAASAAPTPLVSVAPVVRRDLPVLFEASGTIVPLQSVEVRPQVNGTLVQLHIEEGQSVARGQLLFTLDDRTARTESDRARAQWLRDRAQLADLERQERRARELLAAEFVSAGALESVQAQVQAQQAVVQADEAAMRAAEVAMSDTRLKAPMAGRVGAITVRPGARVQTTGEALAVIRQMDPIGVGFAVPASALPSLVGAQAPVATVEVQLPPAAQGGMLAQASTWSGAIHFVDSAVDSATGTVAVKGRLDNADRRLWPGQFVQVRLKLATLRQVLVIPQAALQQRGTERQVYVVDPDGRARLQPVRLRHTDGDLAAVDGVDEGARVIVEGRQQVRPGTRVRVTDAAQRSGGRDGSASAVPAAASGRP